MSMGNPQHLEWLLEGVEPWNARREQEPFFPDLSGMDVRSAFMEAGKLDSHGKISLDEINFESADLSKANFERAVLAHANLDGANCRATNFRLASFFRARVRDCDLRSSDLRNANLTYTYLYDSMLNGAQLENTMLRGTELSGASVRSFIESSSGTRLIVTDLSRVKWLTQSGANSLSGDTATILPKRLYRPNGWPDVQLDLNSSSEGPILAEPEPELRAPLVRASALDFAFSDAGIEARLSEEQAIHPPLLAGGCGTRRDALIDNARHIAKTINNQLAEQSRSDLIDYAGHLETADPANPHRLNFIAVGIRADLEDDFKSGGFDNRLRRQLDDFLDQHKTFLNDCAPEAAEAIRIKAEAVLAEPVSKEQVTEMLDKLTTAIEATESATASVEKMLEDMRAYDDELTALKLKITDARERVQHEAKVQAEAKELITITSRLFWRAREAVEKYRPKDIHEIAAYVGAATGGYPAAVIIINQLTPVMQWFGKLLTALPPI